MNNELATSKKSKNCWPVLKDKEFWGEFFFRIGNGESLLGISKDLCIPKQLVVEDGKGRVEFEEGVNKSYGLFHISTYSFLHQAFGLHVVD